MAIISKISKWILKLPLKQDAKSLLKLVNIHKYRRFYRLVCSGLNKEIKAVFVPGYLIIVSDNKEIL